MSAGGGRAGTGYVEIRPELVADFAKELNRDIERKVKPAEVPVEPGEVDTAKAKQAGTKMGDAVIGGLIGLGAVAGDMLMKDFDSFMVNQNETNRIAGALGLDPEGRARVLAAGQELYKGLSSSSIEEGQRAAEAVLSSMADINTTSQAELVKLAAGANAVATAFGIDVVQATSVAGQSAEEFGITGVEALDLLTASLTGVDAYLRQDLLEAIDEYTPFLQEMGYTAEEAFGLFATAAREGKFELDKMPDAVKELHNRMLDFDHADSNAGLMSLGIPDPKAFKQRIMAGGDEAQAAINQLLDELMAKKNDPRAKQWAMQIFGTQFEDITSIDTLALLKPIDDALGQTQGKADHLVQSMTPPTGAWDQWWRDWEVDRQNGLNLLVSDFGGAWSKLAEGAGQTVEKVEMYFGDGLRRIGEFFGHYFDTVEEAFGEIPGWAGGAVEQIEALFGRIPEFMGYVFDGLEEVMLGPFKAAFNAVAGMWNGIQVPQLGPFHFSLPFGKSIDVGPWGPWDFPDIPSFDGGGVVPGTVGSPQMVLAHGGETILPTHKPGSQGLGGPTFNYNVQTSASPAEVAQANAALMMRRLRGR